MAAAMFSAAVPAQHYLAFDLEENSREQSELAEENSKLNQEINETEKTIAEKEEYQKELQKQISDLSQKIKKSTETIEKLNSEIVEKQKQIDEKLEQIQDRLDLLRSRIRSIYISGDTSSLEIILQAKNFSDFIDKAQLMQSISEYDTKLINGLQSKMEKISLEQTELRENKSKVEEEKRSLENNKKKINELSQENTKLIEELKSEKESAEENLKDNEARQEELQKALESYNQELAEKYIRLRTQNEALARIRAAAEAAKKAAQEERLKAAREKAAKERAEREKAAREKAEKEKAEQKKAAQNAQDEQNTQTSQNVNSENDYDNNNDDYDDYYDDYIFENLDGGWVWPCPGHTYLTSTFDEWRGENNHGALDIADGSVYGAYVVAAYDGTVFSINTDCTHDYGKYESCGCGGGYGNYVMIDHGDGRISIYGHLSIVLAEVGETVSAGEIIGCVGSTGYSTGPHLHFETRFEGVRYDPLTEY